MKITFLGAAREVTGAAFLIESGDLRILIDCGMFQGGPEADTKNRAAFEFDPARIDFALVTHAHLDHCGRLPLLAARGYRGAVYATSATCDLAAIMLKDSAHIQEHEAAWAAKRGKAAANPLLYTITDVEQCLPLLHGLAYGEVHHPHPRIRFRFQDAGHILGAAIVELWIEENGRERKLVYSGDLGQPTRPLVRDPTMIDSAELLIVESTYGNRLHRGMAETLDELVATINASAGSRHGNTIIPAFALGRTQELLTVLIEETRKGRLHKLQVFVDSPLATAATRISERHKALLDDEARHALFDAATRRLPIKIKFIESPEESKALNRRESGAVIIASSGMCDGGRIKHHLLHNLSRPGSAILFTGFQAAGTLGRRIVDGAHSVRIFGEDVQVRASIHTLGGLSAHADQNALIAWLRHFDPPPQQSFVVHGEAATAQLFATTIQQTLGWHVLAPERGTSVEC